MTEIIWAAIPWLIIVYTAMWAGYMLGIAEGKKRQKRIQDRVVGRLMDRLK
jgi:hypothetical protein